MSSSQGPIPIRDLAYLAKPGAAVHPISHTGREQNGLRRAALSRETDSVAMEEIASKLVDDGI